MENRAVRKMSSIIKKFGRWRATDSLKIGVRYGHHAEVFLRGMGFHSLFWLVHCSWCPLYSCPSWPFPPVKTQQQARKPWPAQPKPSQDASSAGCLKRSSPLCVARCSVTATLKPQDYCGKPVQRIQVGFDVHYSIQRKTVIIKEIISSILQPILASNKNT